MGTSQAHDAARLYDQVADQYDAHYRRPEDVAEDRALAAILRPRLTGRTVLDVGCGTGHLLDLIPRELLAGYIGVDASPRMLDVAERKHPLAHFEHCRWPDADGFLPRFDAVVSLWAYPYFAGTRSLFAMWQHTKPGGTLVVQGFARRYLRRPHYVLNGRGANVIRPTTWRSIADDARTAGWRVDRVDGFRYLPDNPLHGRLSASVQAALMRAACELLPPALATTHLLHATKPTTVRRFP